MLCRVCDRPIYRKVGWGAISFNHGEGTIEHLKNWTGRMEVCMECGNALRAWLKMPPFHRPSPEDLEGMPRQPFSCFDERLSLYGD